MQYRLALSLKLKQFNVKGADTGDVYDENNIKYVALYIMLIGLHTNQSVTN